MPYQPLARKHRPQDFSSVVGQEPIVTALRNALTEGRIAQAYLFSGIRGVGKTTAARVLAKALNCERGPAADPCNECASCREITAGADLDVIEVDAATYSKVEQVRDLTEGLKYGPARDRYKVVVIDEIHRLSRQAFDALLKIVEEPPPRLVFIFATTEVDAVPATVLSRCQEFHFRRVPSEVVTKLLAAIAAEEGIVASDAALRLIARAGEGSVRDAVALLDQLATFGSGTVPDDEAVRLLGGLDTALFERLLGAIAEGDRGTVAELVARVEDEGWDPRHVYAQFLAYCRDALHLALDGRTDRVDLPREEAQRLAERACRVGFENLLRVLQQLLASEETVRRSDASSLAVEIAWLRAAELPRLTRVEELLSGRAPGRAPTREPAGRGAAPAAGSPGPAASRPAPAAMKVEPVAPRPGPAAPALAPATGAAAEAGDVIAGILDWLADRKPALASHLRASEARRFAGGTFEVVVAPDDDLLWSRLDKPANRELLEQAVTEVCGPDAGWTRTRSSGRPPAPAGGPASARAEPPAEDPTFQAVLDIFKDTVERVERNEES
jgi:DNA polymerase-3 subunit gamma/tau